MADPNIFSAYDLRGVVPQQWDEDDAYNLGRAFGTFFKKRGANTCYLGRDNRLTSPLIAKKISRGLRESGIDVVNLGIVITPMIYFSWHYFKACATVMVTASHNPPEYNGLKSSLNGRPIFEKDLEEIKQIFFKKTFSTGSGSEEKKEIAFAYINFLQENIKIRKDFKVAIDTGNGTVGLFAEKIFKNEGCRVTSLFAESDGSFPHHHPYPQKTELYAELVKKLKKGHYDLGLAFDGDGDRLGIYDSRGQFIENDLLAGIFSCDICEKNPGAKIVLNVSTTMEVLETVEEAGGQPLLWKTGYPNISQKMKEVGALFGGEISGHFFFADRYFGFDDAVYAALRLLELIEEKRSLEKLREGFPHYCQIPEFRLKLPAGKNKYELIAEIGQSIEKKYPRAKILTIDGIRFSFPNGWGLIRASNTEPLLSGRAEGKTPQDLEKIRAIINEELAKAGVGEGV
ncbi:phosphomannomutase/phosphoglucomutase [Candidatus Shapirobacteria bacterium]|nr:phosphomannomutase/phosphoglucomutase [Candidatus Shapirobacteria bacterium]